MVVLKPILPSIPVKLPTGTALKAADLPTLFTPIKIRGLQLQNRFVVSPMGTWSSQDGELNDFHVVHYGQFALRGAGLTVIESTAVSANGRTSPQDAGLWKDSQVVPLKRVVDFVHLQGQKVGIQLNHAGRKASILAPELSSWTSPMVATELDGGWPDNTLGPSTFPYSEAYVTPKAMKTEDISLLVRQFTDATERAVKAGIDFVEIHGAHGYLIHQFMSPVTNKRTDEYGGTFENRIRLLCEVIRAVRNKLPDSIPLSLRISATDWMEWTNEPSWDLDQSIRLAKQLPGLGVDILDVSSGGISAAQKIIIKSTYQSNLARIIRGALQNEGTQLIIATVGFIDSPEIARDVVQGAGVGQNETISNQAVILENTGAVQADLAFIGRAFAREPGFVLRSALELGVQVQWPFQYGKAQPKNT